MHMAIPRKMLGIQGDRFAVEFKWIDNTQRPGDILDAYINGDSAPGGRYRYRYDTPCWQSATGFGPSCRPQMGRGFRRLSWPSGFILNSAVVSERLSVEKNLQEKTCSESLHVLNYFA